MPDSAASRARTGARAELHLADVLAVDALVDALAAHVVAVAFMARPASQLLPPAPSPTRVSLLLSLGVLHKASASAAASNMAHVAGTCV